MVKGKKVKGFDFTELKYDPAWKSAIDELHARPALTINSAARIVHIAFRCSDLVANQLFQTLEEQKAKSGPRHCIGQISGNLIKVERHTEFVSCTLATENKALGESALFSTIAELLPLKKVKLITFLNIEIASKNEPGQSLENFLNAKYRATLAPGFSVASNYLPQSNGALAFFCCTDEKSEIGPNIQRLIELETYRVLSMEALPIARKISIQLDKLEKELATLSNNLLTLNESEKERQRTLFEQLTDISNRAASNRSMTRYRFAATRAYSSIVEQRLNHFGRFHEVGDMLAGFIRSRLNPAIATISSVDKRQEELALECSRAIEILRTHIELGLSHNNTELLKSMNQRHQQQLIISQTVEGLSAVAITYYAVGLVSYLIKALGQLELTNFNEAIVISISIPMVFLTVFFGLRRLRKSWGH